MLERKAKRTLLDRSTQQNERQQLASVTNDTSVTRSITDTDVDRLRVTLTIPSLQVLEDDGDVVGNSVQIKIQIQYNSGGYNDVITTRSAVKAATVISEII